jgi:spore coat polysaccharide biosynthesis protein SpsF (cytidylyltransferase family)
MTTDPIRTVAIIQARMSSSRLPGKVLLDIAGQPMLAHVIERTRLAQTVSQSRQPMTRRIIRWLSFAPVLVARSIAAASSMFSTAISRQPANSRHR